jgi:hypothetical protein
VAIYSPNQNRWSFASGECNFNGQKFVGLQSFNPVEEVKKERVYGNGRKAIGRVRGQHTASASCEMVLTEYDQLIQALGPGFTDIPFDISVTYIETAGDGVFTIQCSQVTITKVEQKASNDGKAIIVALDLDLIDPINWNGQTMVEVDDTTFDFDAAGLTVTF